MAVAVVGVGYSFPWSADIGAQLHQARSLVANGETEVDHPFPEVDPDGTLFPFHLTSRGVLGGYVVFPKHRLHTVLVGHAFAVGGLGAVIAFSAAGTVLAAAATERLANLIMPGAGPSAFWIAGIASPLLVYGVVGYAHTMAAAALAFATVAVVDSQPNHGLKLVGGCAVTALAVMMRTEAGLAGLALAVGLATAAVHGRRADGSAGRQWRRDGVAAGLMALTTVVSIAADRALAIPHLGLVLSDPRNASYGLIDGRFAALYNSWLRPGFRPEDFLVVIAAAATLATGVSAGASWNRSAPVGPLQLGLVAVAVAASAARLAIDPALTVPGMVMAVPLLFAGLVPALRLGPLSRPTILITTTFAVYCGAVLATQYPYGAGAEWGGRYFTVGLPWGLAVAAAGWHRLARTDRWGRIVVAGVMASAVLAGIGGLVGVGRARSVVEKLDGQVASASTSLGGDRPVVITTVEAVPRLLWERVDQGRWLLATPGSLAELNSRLTRREVQRLVLVSADADRDLALLSHYRLVGPCERSGSLAVCVVATPSLSAPASGP